MDIIFLSSCVPKSLTTLMRPLGPYQVAWYLRKHNYSVQVLEFLFRMSEEEILKLIDSFVTKDTRIIGLGAMIQMTVQHMGSTIKKFENVLYAVKKRYPNIKIITGGPASPFWSRLHRNKTLFDYIFTGHAEDTMLALCDHIIRDAPHPQFEINDGNKFIRETFKMPHDHVFDIETDDHIWHDSDCIQPGEALPLELSRGCIFKCKFCRYPYIGKSKNDFARNMECIKNELIDNYNRFGATNYYMLDDTFNADQDRMAEFYKMTETLPFKINYATYLRTDLLAAHPDTQYMLLESGLKGAYLGIETLNPEAANLIGKNWNPKAREYLPKLHNDIWQRQVNFHVGLICGIPPETFEDCLATGQFCIDNGMPGWLWYGLNVSRDSHDEFKSEFDINAERYGFEWITEDGKPMWKTKYATHKIALQWSVKLMEQAKPHQLLCGWYLMEVANYKYDINQYLHLKEGAWPWREINVKRNEFLENYVNDLRQVSR